MKQVYKITYPTGKIYVDKDNIGSARYMGRPDMSLVNADFEALPEEIRRNYTLRKEILRKSSTATEAELSAMEVDMIRRHRSNDPAIGYNRWSKLSIDNDFDSCPPMPTSLPPAQRSHSSAGMSWRSKAVTGIKSQKPRRLL